MRTGPVVLAHLDDPAALVDAAMMVSDLTHHQDLAQEACAVWCLMLRHSILTGEYATFDDIGEHVPSAEHWRHVLTEAEHREPIEFRQNAWAVGALQAA